MSLQSMFPPTPKRCDISPPCLEDAHKVEMRSDDKTYSYSTIHSKVSETLAVL